MPNYSLKVQLDLACEQLRRAIIADKVRPSEDDIKKKWAEMALESTQKKAMKLARGIK